MKERFIGDERKEKMTKYILTKIFIKCARSIIS